ncbi:hypothetical protein KI387_042845, partial [Taxus chinensis]
DFLATMELKVRDFTWTQNLYYESLPFRCRSCFALGHLVADCHIVKKQIKGRVSWWKDFNPKNLTVEAEEENNVTQILDNHIGDLGKEKVRAMKEMNVKNLSEIATLPYLPVNDPHVVDKGISPLSPHVSLFSPDQSSISLEISLPINPEENVDPNWGEGWKLVNNKKRGKDVYEPLLMSLRSRKGK